jgi:hypothetical protein
MSHPNVGVLLPVRLETVFDQPDGAGTQWRLRLLIVPDEAAIDRHDPRVSREELESLETLWRATGGDLQAEGARDAFRQMAARHGPARILWLARTFPPLRDDVGNLAPDDEGHVIDHGAAIANLRDRPRVSSIEGFPDALEVWMALEDGTREQIASTTIDHQRLNNVAPDQPDAEAGWWTSWEAAQEAGLGLEITLPMTEETELAQIEALIVVGVGDEGPAPLFADHRDSGTLAVLELGTPTNTLAGASAADLGRDPEMWRSLWGAPRGASDGDLGLALMGNPDAMAPLPGGDLDHRRLDGSLVRALWPALWGHALKDIWGLGDQIHELGLWAGEYLCPEGPLAPIRINDQPYGVLPTTSLALWQAAPDDPALEEQMAPLLAGLRRRLARDAGDVRTIVGADSTRVVDILSRTPTSSQYAHRSFMPLELLYLAEIASGAGIPFDRFVNLWNEIVLARAAGEEDVLAEAAERVRPVRRYTAVGYPQDLRLPLLHPPEEPPGYFYKWLEYLLFDLGNKGGRGAFNVMIAPEFSPEFPHPAWPPNSLLLRLLIFSWLVGDAEWKRRLLGFGDELIEPLFNTESTLLERWVSLDEPMDPFEDVMGEAFPPQMTDSPQFRIFRQSLIGSRELFDYDPEHIGRSEEIERALRATLDTASHRVDPWITGIAHRRLEKLQRNGAQVGLGVYGWVDRPFTGRRGPTQGGLLHAPSDAQARAAIILRDKAVHDPQVDRWKMSLDSTAVRLAKQFADEVRAGSHIQEVIGRAIERAIGDREVIERLRDAYPIRREHTGRRVCDGQRVLAAAEDELAELGLSQEQMRRLEPLSQIVDVYADLLVAEGVFDVVAGRPEAAGAAMEAAAALALPPELEVLRMPRQGRSVSTVVLIALPEVAGPEATDVGVSPGELADPSVAAWLARETLADGGSWVYQVNKQDGTPVAVALEELGLAPVDALALTEDAMSALAVRVAGGTQLDAEADATKNARALHERVRRLAALLSRQPAHPRDLARAGEVPADGSVEAELRDRLGRLIDAAKTLSDALHDAASGSEVVARRRVVRAAARWGIAPTLADDEEDVTATTYVERVKHLLDERRQATPTDPEALTLRQLAEAISALAGAGRLPILGSVSRAALDGVLGESLIPEPTLDRDWLEVVAAVRGPLARLESHQLEAMGAGRQPLRALTNRPGDPWQRSVPRTTADFPRPSTLFVVYDAQSAMDVGGAVKLALLDSWAETVPEEQHTTTAAFGFNAPAARPPQAILIAVPPIEDQPLDAETLAEIVLETRELAHARMTRPEDVPELAGVFPLVMLPTAPLAGVRLDVAEV